MAKAIYICKLCGSRDSSADFINSRQCCAAKPAAKAPAK